MKEYYFFWKGPLSQWTNSEFIDDEGITYNTAEQYMMYQKAKLFGDVEIMREILNTTSPREQQKLGRLVNNFDQNIWNENAISIVTKGNIYKFSQNKHLRDLLIETKDKFLVEASPIDKVWGIGLAEDNPLIVDESNWQGTNWLGICLMNTRDYIINNYSKSDNSEFL